MLSELLHKNEYENPYWALWQISLGSMACMCCVVFLGLKFKRFRAQLRLGKTPTSNVAAVPVQGVGFKLKSNPDDFQLYKVTSEFVPVTNQNQQKPIQQQNGAQSKKKVTAPTPVTSKPVPPPTIPNSNKSTTTTQVSSKSTTSNSNKSTTMTQVPSKPTSQTSNSNATTNKTNIPKQQLNTNQTPSTTNNKTNIPKKQPSTEEYNQPAKQPILKIQDSDEQKSKKSTVNFKEDHIEILIPSAHKYSDLVNKPLKQITNNDDESEQQYPNDPYQKQQQTNINDVAKQPMLHIKNPLATRNIVMPIETEDDWKIKIVDEKPKERLKQEQEEEMNELYFTGGNSNTSSMYSSQAASIFFAAQAPVVRPRPRKFEEIDEDVISSGSQTSA